jgi:hypothetical protein
MAKVNLTRHHIPDWYAIQNIKGFPVKVKKRCLDMIDEAKVQLIIARKRLHLEVKDEDITCDRLFAWCKFTKYNIAPGFYKQLLSQLSYDEEIIIDWKLIKQTYPKMFIEGDQNGKISS